jgi:deazaflavin-dependent oxidoreductase (nitroreductase family)
MTSPQPSTTPSPPPAFARIVLRPIARTINPLMCRLAGRRYASFVSIVYHQGRRSGRQYATVVEGRVFGDRVVVPLAFGTEAEWCRNLRAAGRGHIKWRGKEYEITSPQIFTYESIRPLIRDAFPTWVRITFPVMGFNRFLVMKVASPN